ncbi:MAG: hypothetical protein ACPGQP_03870, partial [Nitrosopumilus sp.]
TEIKDSDIEKQETKQDISDSFKNKFNFGKPKESKIDSIEIPSKKLKQSFELTTLTNISKIEPKVPLFENEKVKSNVVNPMPKPRITQSKIIKPKEEIVQEIIQPKLKIEDKIEVIQSIVSKSNTTLEHKPDLNKEVAKITEYKALPEPKEQKPKPTTSLDEEFDDDVDDLDKIKGDIMKVLSKLDQAEVE